MSNEQKVYLIDRLATFYHSDYVKHCQPWVLEMPFDKWLERQLLRIGGESV